MDESAGTRQLPPYSQPEDAAAANDNTAKDDAALLDSSLIPFVEKIGASCDSLFTALASPLVGADEKLRDFDSRLRYGSQRLKIVQNLVARNGSVGAAEIQRLAEQNRRDALVGEIDSLKAELDRVGRERESLAVKLRNDAQLLEEKMKQAGKLAEVNDFLTEKLETAKQRISHLEDSIAECREAHAGALAAKEEEIRYFQNRVLEYEKLVKEKEAGVEVVVEGRVDEVVRRFEEERKTLKDSLDESQRELAKAKANLIQVERELSQERSSGRAVLKDLEDSQSMINANLRDEIHNLQSEQNLILNTIRRQGLVEPLLHAVRGNPRHQSLYKQLNALPGHIPGGASSSGGGAFVVNGSRSGEDLRSDASSGSSRSNGASSRDPTSVPALDIVINNLESEDGGGGGGGGILSNLSGASSPAYTHEQMMAAIRELQNDVNLLCNDPNNGTFRPDDGRYQ